MWAAAEWHLGQPRVLQQPHARCWPQGQGVAPPGSVKLYLTVLVERVLTVDQHDYNFEASAACVG